MSRLHRTRAGSNISVPEASDGSVASVPVRRKRTKSLARRTVANRANAAGSWCLSHSTLGSVKPSSAGLHKVLRLKHHEPAAFARLATVLLAKDFVRLRLTGTLATEPSDASGTLMFDPARVRWSREILDAVGLPPSLLPEVGGSAEVLGHVTPGAAALMGLVAGTPV